MNTTTVFIEALDVLFLRGNQHFGSAGAHGAALMPPWPSLAAGALRSRLMAAGHTIESLHAFRLTHFGLARLQSHTAQTGAPASAPAWAEPLLPLPADLMVTSDAPNLARYARPTPLHPAVRSSHTLEQLAVQALPQPAKPVGGLWLNGQGIGAWQAGQAIGAAHLIQSSKLWRIDERLGIALDPHSRSAADGKIYTAEAVALQAGVGLLASYVGAPALPAQTLLRLGGDGRAGVLHSPRFNLPAPDWARIERERRFRLLLRTPGLFANGWQPDGIPAHLVAASVGRSETVSGWDLLTGAPKPAQRLAPAGSVYWFDTLTDPAALRHLLDNGLPLPDGSRRAEGFNHCLIAPWVA